MNPAVLGSVGQLSATAKDWTQELKWSFLHSHIQNKARSCFGNIAEETERSSRLTKSSRTSYDLPCNVDHWLLWTPKLLCKMKPPDFSPTEYWEKTRLAPEKQIYLYFLILNHKRNCTGVFWEAWKKDFNFCKIWVVFFSSFYSFHST